MKESGPSKRTQGTRKKPILVILDMNGVLMKRTEDRTGAVFRPHLETFIERMWKLYPRVNVGIWSSMASKNLNFWVESAFGERTAELAFIWDQQWCTKKEVEGMSKPLLRKDLIWLSETTWASFAPNHVLLIDDDPIKCTKNPKGTALHPASFDGLDDDDEELLLMAEYLESFVRSECKTVPEFVLGNPYKSFDVDQARKQREYLETVGDETVNMVEVYMQDVGEWMPQSAKDVEELPNGSMRIRLADGQEMVVPAKYVRDFEEEQEEPQAKKGRVGEFDPDKKPTKLKVVSMLSETSEADVSQKKEEDGPSRLPPAWKRLESRSSPGVFYYYNSVTGESSFEPPLVRLGR